MSTLAILNAEADRAGLTGVRRLAFLATAWVESTFDPKAVGDNGTSYGLFQHHVGGAGGTTHTSARRYLDPVTSARERASQFARLNIKSGTGAAALQRPADPSGYAVKVNAAMASQPWLKSGSKQAYGPKQGPLRDQVEAIMRRNGLTVTSNDRTPDHNRKVGGVANSSHLTTRTDVFAVDGVGTETAMRSAKAEISKLKGITENMIHDAGSGRHLHVAGLAGAGASSGGDVATSDTHQVGLLDGASKIAGLAVENFVWIVVLAVGLIGALAITGVGVFKATGTSPAKLTPAGKALK